jgi:hypothetical protein
LAPVFEVEEFFVKTVEEESVPGKGLDLSVS